MLIHLHGQDVLSFSAVSLDFETDFAHAFSTFAGLDAIGLFALCGCFGAHLLVQLLLAPLSLLLKTFVDVDGSSLVDVASLSMTGGVGIFAVIVQAESIELAEMEAPAARQ